MTAPKGDVPVVAVEVKGDVPPPVPAKGDPLPFSPACVKGALFATPKGDDVFPPLVPPNGDGGAALPPKGT